MGSCNILLSSQRFCCLLSYRADWISELSVWLTFQFTSLCLQESWSARFASAHTLAPSSTASCSPPRARHYNLRARKGKHRVKASSRSFQYTVFSYLSRSYPKHYCIHKYWYLGLRRHNRYWKKEFKYRGPEHLQELFNYHHSKLRNVVERTFGVAKNKWQMLKGMPNYPTEKQCGIIVSCFALHNFVQDENARSSTVGPMLVPPISQYSNQWVESNAEDDMATLRDWITTGLGVMGFGYVSLQKRFGFWCW